MQPLPLQLAPVHGRVVIAGTGKSSIVAMGVSEQMVQRLQQCVVVVDPYSTGGMLAAELLQRNYSVLALWTSEVEEPLGRALQHEFRVSFQPLSASICLWHR